MKKPSRQNRLVLPVALSLLAVLAPSGLCAQPGFARVVNLPYSGGVQIIDNMWRSLGSETTVNTGGRATAGVLGGSTGAKSPTQGASSGASSVLRGTSAGARPAASVIPRKLSVNVRPLVLSQWQAARQRIIDSAMIYFNERDIGGGFRTSRNRVTLAEDGPMFVGWDGRGFTVKLALQQNRISTYLRTPTPLDRDLDPGFEVAFDVDVLIDIEVRNNQLVAGPVRLQPHVKRPEGKNVTGDLAVGLANLLSAISDVDFVGLMLTYVNGQNFAFQTGLNRELAQLNPVLQAAAAGGAIIPGFDTPSNNITLTLRRAGPVEVVR